MVVRSRNLHEDRGHMSVEHFLAGEFAEHLVVCHRPLERPVRRQARQAKTVPYVVDRALRLVLRLRAEHRAFLDRSTRLYVVAELLQRRRKVQVRRLVFAPHGLILVFGCE